jgi:hypothetical protein
MTRCGLPHSDTPGSKLVCSSPGLIAACHVLHRLLAPRHSPYTLSSLTIRNSKLTLTNCLHNQLVCDSSMCKHCVCLWSEKTTVCRIFSCQRSNLGPSPPDLKLAVCPRNTEVARICLRRRPVGCATNIAALTADLKPATTKQRSRRRLQRTRRSCYAPKLFCQITSGLPTAARLRPSSEGWWRIPGSNR